MTTVAALAAGLVTSFHCVGMCGPIACGLGTLAKSEGERLTAASLYHGTRLVSYGLIGALCGALGQQPLYDHRIARGRAGIQLARAAATATLDSAGWEALKRGTLELVERQVSHIQRETMALLPMLEDLLDEDSDRELAFAYASG